MTEKEGVIYTFIGIFGFLVLMFVGETVASYNDTKIKIAQIESGCAND